MRLFRPFGEVRNIFDTWHKLLRVTHQIVGTAGKDLLNSKAFWLIKSGEVNNRFMPDIEHIFQQKHGKSSKVGISLIGTHNILLFPCIIAHATSSQGVTL